LPKGPTVDYLLRQTAVICICGVVLLMPQDVSAVVLRVKILVDEEEATRPNIWHKRLTDRVNKASEIISRYADVKLAVQSYGTWDSDDSIQDFSQSLRELEREVKPSPAQIVIGFSSQYRFQYGRNHLGGTRGPMNPYVLIRENARTVLEPERLEVLVHELGHFLGAAHSGRPQSVMRPVVGDGQARAKSYQIAFDPHNAEILRMVSGELRNRRVRGFHQLSATTLKKLRPHYAALVQEAPDDPAAARFLFFVDNMLQRKN
jgi:hypothetical protein